MRVALLTSARSWRGSGTSFVNIARGLLERGHAVQLFATAAPVTEAFAAQGLPVRELPIHDTGLREARILARALREHQSDVVLAEKPRDLRVGALASLVRRFALVYRHNVGQETPPRDPIVRLAYRRVALTVFLTRAAEACARAVAPFMVRRPARVIYEGVDVAQFRPDEAAGRVFRQRHALGDRPFLLAVGALEHEKRYPWLLDALARLGSHGPPLLICGEGGHAGLIRDQAARLGLDVRLVGFLAPAELAAAYNAATCVVHACTVETFGLALAEALACGRPVVAVGGAGGGSALAEVLGDAAVLTADEPEQYVLTLTELLADPPRRRALGEAARRRAVELFSLERMRGEYAAALEAASG
jgi:glycosyltransferase involved in cell wall biosynthesis